MKLKLRNINTKVILIIVAIVIIFYYFMKGIQERYTGGEVGPSANVGPSAVTQEDLDLIEEMVKGI